MSSPGDPRPGVEQVADTAAYRPAAGLRPFVERYVGYRLAGFSPGTHQGLPSRHLTLIISFDDPLEVTTPSDQGPTTSRLDAAVGGLHALPAVIHHDGSTHGVHLQVTTAGARALFGLPASELVSTVVPLADLWGPLATELFERLAVTSDWSTRFHVLDDAIGRRLAAAPRHAVPDDLAFAWQRLATSDGRQPVAALAREIGWSRRHFTTRFTSEFGLGPKAAARVLRFERSHHLLLGGSAKRPTTGLADIAVSCGYADQAHMARDWVELAGASPTRWLAAEPFPFVQDPEPVPPLRR